MAYIQSLDYHYWNWVNSLQLGFDKVMTYWLDKHYCIETIPLNYGAGTKLQGIVPENDSEVHCQHQMRLSAPELQE
jgi:hypothetical protein